MGNKLKSLVAVSAIIGIPALINHIIFKKAAAKSRLKSKEFHYDWKFGRVRYAVSGEGRPLLLIHGIGAGCGSHEWDNNIEMLSRRYKVYAIDLIGFGGSQKPAISYSPYLYIELINDFIKHIIKEKVYVAASSNSAAYAVGAYNFMPGLFERMILISPTGVGSAKNLPHSDGKWIRRLLETPVFGTAFYNAVCSKFFIRYFLEEYCFVDKGFVEKKLINKFYDAAHYGGAASKYPVAAFLTNFLNVDIERFLTNIKIPVHVIWGDKNNMNPVENFGYVEEANSDIGLTVFKGTSLLPHYENNKSFYRVCKEFFV